MDPAVVALIGVVVGTVLGAGLQEWRARNDDSRVVMRERRQRTSDYTVRRLIQTRERLGLDTAYVLAWMLSSDDDVRDALSAMRAADTKLADNMLIGEDEPILAWLMSRDEVVAAGRLKPDGELLQRVYDARDACFSALDRQIIRALNDQPLSSVSPETRQAVGRAVLADRKGLHRLHGKCPT
jgi:hypothetical protein